MSNDYMSLEPVVGGSSGGERPGSYLSVLLACFIGSIRLTTVDAGLDAPSLVQSSESISCNRALENTKAIPS